MSWASVARAIVIGAYELAHEAWKERQREKKRRAASEGETQPLSFKDVSHQQSQIRSATSKRE